MSQPHAAIDLSSSNPVTRPSFGQFSLSPPGSSAPQPIFNKELIPRDYLDFSPKTLSNPTSESENGLPKSTLFTIDPFQHDREKQERRSKSSHGSILNEVVNSNNKPLSARHKQQNNGLEIQKARLTKSGNPPSKAVKARSTSYTSPSSPKAHDLDTFIMPRTSSIDSAISNVSSTSLTKAAAEIRDPSPASVRNLIATAGGAENLVTHLLKDKNGVSSQNAQLWKLVEKQRALIFGLNKDLERVTKERDKYKKRVKDLEIHSTSTNGTSAPTPELPSSLEHVLPNLVPAMADQPRVNLRQASGTLPTYLPSSPETYPPQAQLRKGIEVVEQQDSENTVMPNQPILPEVYVNYPNKSSPTSPGWRLDLSHATAPVLNVIEASPLAEKPIKSLPSTRKAPPKPLNLAQGKGDGQYGTDIDTGTETIDLSMEQDRGRRRTREEDDRDREISAKKAENEARSRSKKNQVSQLLPASESQAHFQPFQPHVPLPLPTPGLPLSPRPQHAQTFVAPSAHLTAPGIGNPASIGERLLAAPLRSPGLPLSPRPQNRNEMSSMALSLPLSPRANMGAFPLSPRAPKHALPAPTVLAAPADAAILQNKQSRGHQSPPQAPASFSSVDRLQVHQPVGSDPPPIYRGLAVSTYPNLLLPPNALPSIQVKVHSSRLRPSRHTVLMLKSSEDTTVFSLSIISRSSSSELWRTEKVPGALAQLEQQLKPRCSDLPRLPDRRVFAGHSPALLDERRIAIDNYFEELLDIHIDEQAAITICKFLSSDVIDPEQQGLVKSAIGSEPSPQTFTSGAPSTKSGYLTKRGKNFGGWKTRFFVLEGSDLRYYETAGGPYLGTIKLSGALIGKQREADSTEDNDGQFRHAFLIQEPKRKDSSSYTRHVLCAESDTDRDNWVNALLYWVEGGVPNRTGSNSEPSANNIQEQSNGDTQYARTGPGSKDTHTNTPTPTSGSSIDSSILEQAGSLKQADISGPMNGTVITDAAMWNCKPQPAASTRDARDKTHKMSNIFGFKKPGPSSMQQDPKPTKPRILRHNGYVRPVFGLPLTDAVEFCTPFNVDVDLPAVVYRCIEYLRFRNAAGEEGLFRLSGSNIAVRNLKERFNTEGDVDLIHEEEYHDVHAVASLFKTYLRELPSTLLTRDLHIEFIKVLDIESNSEKVMALNGLVSLLPAANLSLLKEMSKYLLEVTGNADKNKMSVRNVGIVFSPTLNIPTPVFTLFLTEYHGIFETQSGQTPTIRRTELRAPAELTPDDIRSPRKQVFSDLPTPSHHQTSFSSHPAVLPPRGTMTGTGELGFMPINPIYESGSYVTPPRATPLLPAQPLTQMSDGAGFSSLNGLLAPRGPTDKARKRHSQIYMNPPDLQLG